jgi:hypothetical protein
MQLQTKSLWLTSHCVCPRPVCVGVGAAHASLNHLPQAAIIILFVCFLFSVRCYSSVCFFLFDLYVLLCFKQIHNKKNTQQNIAQNTTQKYLNQIKNKKLQKNKSKQSFYFLSCIEIHINLQTAQAGITNKNLYNLQRHCLCACRGPLSSVPSKA